MQKSLTRKITWYTVTVLALWLAAPLGGDVWAANGARPLSPALQQMLGQVEQVFLAPRGKNINAVIQHPPTFAVLMGIMFQPQIRYARQNPQLTGEFNRLENEAWELIQRAAYQHNFGGQIPQIKQLLIDAAVGKLNPWVMQNYGVNPAQVQAPPVIGASANPPPRGLSPQIGRTPAPPVGGMPSQPTGKIWTDKDSKSVTLLGQQAPRVANPNVQPTRPGVLDLNAEVNQLKKLDTSIIKGFPYIPPGYIDLKKGSPSKR